MLSSYHRWFSSPWDLSFGFSPVAFPVPEVVPQTRTRLQQKLHQSQLEGKASPTGPSGVRRMNFLLSLFSLLWVASMFSTVPLMSLWFGNYFISSLPQLPYNLKRKTSLFHLLFNCSKSVGEGHKQSKWKINTFPSQFRAQQKQKRGARDFIKSWKVQANGNFQFKLELYFGIPQGEVGILPHCSSLML